MNHKAIFGLLVLLVALSFLPLFNKTNAAVPSNELTGYAWSSNIGWLSFNCDNNNSCAIPYRVTIATASGDADRPLSGYAWSSNIGWVDFSGTQLKKSGSNWELTGWAQALAGGTPAAGGWDGKIKMSGLTTGNEPYGVVAIMNGTTPVGLSSYAWGSDVVGWLKFDPQITGEDDDGDGCISGNTCFGGDSTLFLTCSATAAGSSVTWKATPDDADYNYCWGTQCSPDELGDVNAIGWQAIRTYTLPGTYTGYAKAAKISNTAVTATCNTQTSCYDTCLTWSACDPVTLTNTCSSTVLQCGLSSAPDLSPQSCTVGTGTGKLEFVGTTNEVQIRTQASGQSAVSSSIKIKNTGDADITNVCAKSAISRKTPSMTLNQVLSSASVTTPATCRLYKGSTPSSFGSCQLDSGIGGSDVCIALAAGSSPGLTGNGEEATFDIKIPRPVRAMLDNNPYDILIGDSSADPSDTLLNLKVKLNYLVATFTPV